MMPDGHASTCDTFCEWEARWNAHHNDWYAFCPTHQVWQLRLPQSEFPWYEGEKMPGPGEHQGSN